MTDFTSATLLTSTVPESMLSTLLVCTVLLAAAAMYCTLTPVSDDRNVQ